MLDPDAHDRAAGLRDLATRRRLTPPATAGFAGVAQRWGLSPVEQRALLGGLDPSVLIALGQADESRAPLSRDAILRISLLLGAYEGLERVFRGTPAESDAWVRRPNAEAPFSGRTPLDFLLDGGLPAMAATRDYLDAWAGGPPVREARPAGGE